MDDGYKLNETDIRKMVHVLSVFDPENANEHTARRFLLHIQSSTRESLGSLTPEQLVELYKQLPTD